MAAPIRRPMAWRWRYDPHLLRGYRTGQLAIGSGLAAFAFAELNLLASLFSGLFASRAARCLPISAGDFRRQR
jgi:hypothetical protein